MTVKVKTIICFVVSAIGWLVYVIGMLYEKYSPGTNDFSPLIDMLVYVIFSIAASLIHLLNCIYAVIFLLRKSEHRIFNVLGLLSSVLFVIFFSIPLLDFLHPPSDIEEPSSEIDMRWIEYTKEHQAPAKEIQLNQNTAFLVFSKSPTDQKVLYASKHMTSEKYSNIYCLDLASEELIQVLNGHQKSIQALSLSSDSRYAVSGGESGEIIFWDIPKGIKVNSKKDLGYIRSVAYCPVGNQVLVGGDSGEILLWDISQMQVSKNFIGHTSGIRNNCLVWALNGKTFLSGSWDGSIRLWDINSGKELVHLQASYGRVMSIALSPNGKYALSSYLNGPDQPIIFWDLETQQEINRFGVPGNPWHADQRLHVESVAFSSDGKTALFGLVFGTVIWWDLVEWKAISTNRIFEKELAYVYFSEDNKFCIAIGCDQNSVHEMAKIRYWELKED